MKRIYVVLAVACLQGCVDDSTTAEDSPLIGAPPDNAHPFSVGVCFSHEGNCTKSETFACTGSVVAPNLVLTARRCIDKILPATTFCELRAKGDFIAADFQVTTHPDPYSAGANPTWYRAISVMTPEDPLLCNADLALILLGKSIPHSEAVPIALDLAGELAPTEVAIAGRGAVAARFVTLDGTVQVTDDGGKRQRSLEHIPVLCLPDKPGGCAISDESSVSGTFTPSPSQLVVGAAGLPGDYGAAMLDQTSFKQPVLLAVTSGGTWAAGQPNSTFGVHVSKQQNWITNSMAAAASIEEPSGCSATRSGSLLTVLALLFVVTPRRRRTVRRD